MDFHKLFAWKPQHSKVAAVFDIGSGSVAVAVMRIGNANTPSTILVAERRMLSEISRDDVQRTAALTQLTGEVGKSVLDTYAKMPEHGAITDVSAVFHAPHAHARTATASRRFERSTVVTPKLIGALAKEALGEKKPAEGMAAAERSVIQILLNGYPTEEPEGKEAQMLSVTALESAVDAVCQKSIVEAIQTLLPGRTVCLRTATTAVATAVRELALAANYTILDMTSEATGCVSLSGGTIEGVGLVPIGTRTVIETATKDQNMSATEMRSLLRMIAEGTCSDSTCSHVERLLTKAESSFVKPFGEAFASMAEKNKLPNELLLLVPQDIAQWATSFLERIDFGQFTITGKPLRPRILSVGTFAPLVSVSAGVRADAALLADAALVHILS